MSAPAAAAQGMGFVVSEHPDYRQFLEAKIRLASQDGFEVDPAEINPALKPHIQLATRWGLRGGCRAFFGLFGLQKTTWHLEVMRHVQKHTGLPTLITLPLGARISFFKDAETYFTGPHAVKLNFMREDGELDPAAINLTNIECIRAGKIDARRFGGTSYDEGDILRNMNTATFWAFADAVKTSIKYRFVATATPDPQDYVELLAYAGYLDIMEVGEARTRFFQRDSEQADNLTLLPHKADEFWLWVASWALFVTKPSDLDPSFSDEGYTLPPLDVRWHEVPTNHRAAGFEASGQGKLLKDDATGVIEAAAEKRASISARIAKMMELRRKSKKAHRIIWHHLEDERDAIEKAAPEVVTVYGSQDLDARERSIIAFTEGKVKELAGKPVMIGSGPNFQYHCAEQIHLGISPKFKDFIQSVHRTYRFGQKKPVTVHIIHTEAERETRRKLEQRWLQFNEQSARMAALMRKYGLEQIAAVLALTRTIGVAREEVRGERFTIAHNDCVDETRHMAENSVDLIVSSLPFCKQYRYTPSYNDFGHTDDDVHFFRQMDFLTPQLLRVLKPGRNCVIHVKDRIVEGSRSGLGFQTVAPFGALTMLHFAQHGFAYLGTTVINCDVVRENKQTNRLGMTEQCKDGSRMGFGLNEYLHVFRKPQSDRSRGYADDPVVKLIRDFDHQTKEWSIRRPRPDVDESRCDPEGYSRAQWQLDASGYWRSSGNTLLTREEIARLEVKGAHRRWKVHSAQHSYDYAHHVEMGEALMEVGKLRPDFAVIGTHSQHPDVWTDVVRMRSLNTLQVQQGKVKHLCPLPVDLVERVIRQRSMPGELVFDPFGGLGTVPYCAVRLGRRGYCVDLSADYCRDAAAHCRAVERRVSVPTLFDLAAMDAVHAPTETAEAAE